MTKIKERPILFNTEMVRAVLDGRKTQTRRVIKPQPFAAPIRQLSREWRKIDHLKHKSYEIKCPYGKPGDELWVRETWGFIGQISSCFKGIWKHWAKVRYIADGQEHKIRFKSSEEMSAATPDQKLKKGESLEQWWKRKKRIPSIHMPRWASRIQLVIKDVRVERVQDISREDAIAEGLKWDAGGWEHPNHPERRKSSPTQSFEILWDSINKERGFGWDVNPWVWVIEFEKKEKN